MREGKETAWADDGAVESNKKKVNMGKRFALSLLTDSFLPSFSFSRSAALWQVASHRCRIGPSYSASRRAEPFFEALTEFARLECIFWTTLGSKFYRQSLLFPDRRVAPRQS